MQGGGDGGDANTAESSLDQSNMSTDSNDTFLVDLEGQCHSCPRTVVSPFSVQFMMLSMG